MLQSALVTAMAASNSSSSAEVEHLGVVEVAAGVVVTGLPLLLVNRASHRLLQSPLLPQLLVLQPDLLGLVQTSLAAGVRRAHGISSNSSSIEGGKGAASVAVSVGSGGMPCAERNISVALAQE
jgi:hypothetical protein